MRRDTRHPACAVVALLATLLGLALGAASAHAGGTLCIDLAWATAPIGADTGFIVANRGNTAWRSVFVPTGDGRGTVCEAGLPADHYLVCEVAHGGYAIQLLPAPGQTAYATCLGLALADGETATARFRNVPEAPGAAATAIGATRHRLPAPRGGPMERP
jgi:hypothetical protein